MAVIRFIVLSLLVTTIVTYSLPVFARTDVPPDSQQWRFAGDAVYVPNFEGRAAIKIKNGTAFLDEANLADGIIEFDMYVTGERAFAYLQFRGESETANEDLYFRPHKSGLPDAVQYAPVFQRQSAWQLYHGSNGTAAVTLPANRWLSVRVELAAERATVWVGDDEEPVMTVRELGRSPKDGWIGFRGFVPVASPAAYSVAFSRIRLTPKEGKLLSPVRRAPLPKGQLTRWRVSPAFEAPPGPLLDVPKHVQQSQWTNPPMQPSGVFEFLRSRPIPEAARRWAVIAETTLLADTAETCAMYLGYSDEITLSVNDQLVLYQDSGYRFGDRRQDGIMHADQILAYLPLKAGANKVSAAIADRFGGWGLSARLEACDAVETE